MSKKQEIEAACIRQGERLQAEYGDSTIPSNAIVTAVAADCGCTRGEVLVTDRCYNRTNIGIRKADGRLWQNPPLFIREEHGQFRYVGPDYPFTGFVHHKPKPKGEAERIVARCEGGKVVEWLDLPIESPAKAVAESDYGAYLVTYNRDSKPWTTLAAQAEQTRRGELVIEDWNVANQSIGLGDRLYILNQGDGPRGIMGVGRSKSDKPELRPHYDPVQAALGRKLHFIDGEWSVILNPETEALLSDDDLLADLKHVRQSGVGIKAEGLQRIDQLWPLHLARVRGVLPSSDDDDEMDGGFREGRKVWRLHRSFERNPLLAQAKKQEALNGGGKLICSICKFDFFHTYGEVGNGFIECHHLTPLSELREERVTKLEDVILVCSNCHRMLHRKRPWVHTPEELKELVLMPHGTY